MHSPPTQPSPPSGRCYVSSFFTWRRKNGLQARHQAVFYPALLSDLARRLCCWSSVSAGSLQWQQPPAGGGLYGYKCLALKPSNEPVSPSLCVVICWIIQAAIWKKGWTRDGGRRESYEHGECGWRWWSRGLFKPATHLLTNLMKRPKYRSTHSGS